MAIIGTFTLGADGIYSGEISTLTLTRAVRLVPTEATAKNAPDLRACAGTIEIGVAWLKTSRNGDPYYAVNEHDQVV